MGIWGTIKTVFLFIISQIWILGTLGFILAFPRSGEATCNVLNIWLPVQCFLLWIKTLLMLKIQHSHSSNLPPIVSIIYVSALLLSGVCCAAASSMYVATNGHCPIYTWAMITCLSACLGYVTWFVVSVYTNDGGYGQVHLLLRNLFLWIRYRQNFEWNQMANDHLALTEDEIQKLPRSPMQLSPTTCDDEASKLCSICTEPMNEGEVVVTLPQCNHSFHEPCIVLWLKKKGTCPMDRSDIRENLANSPPSNRIQVVSPAS